MPVGFGQRIGVVVQNPGPGWRGSVSYCSSPLAGEAEQRQPAELIRSPPMAVRTISRLVVLEGVRCRLWRGGWRSAVAWMLRGGDLRAAQDVYGHDERVCIYRHRVVGVAEPVERPDSDLCGEPLVRGGYYRPVPPYRQGDLRVGVLMEMLTGAGAGRNWQMGREGLIKDKARPPRPVVWSGGAAGS